jgi:ectoine hydroxylase-related dioxygenase (phytanoyl-CoA dioxygenase family)
MSTATAPAASTTPVYGVKPTAAQVAEWVARFHRDGYVFFPAFLPQELCTELREDFDRVSPTHQKPTECAVRMFEHSRANLDLFECEPIVSLAEALLGEDNRLGTETCHVVHNNSFRTRNGGGWSAWHHDDSPHFLCTDDNPPTNIHLPVLLMTANFYLTDQPTPEHGPGQVVAGSHRFGKVPPADLAGTRWEPQITSCTGNAGSVMVFNSQVWHRGAPNHSDRVRYVTQVSYGRKSISHFFHPFMDYRMPEHCLAWADTPRRKRLLGYLPSGPYG